MPHVIETTAYKYKELSDAAKAKARDWFREASAQDEFWEYIYEDAVRCAAIIGIEIDTKPVKLMGGGTRQDPDIRFSGFWSQGDGASFAGRYEYAAGSSRAIREHAPEDEELHRIADELAVRQFEVTQILRSTEPLSATIKFGSHRYCHSNTMDIEVTTESDDLVIPKHIHEAVQQLMRDFADWIYKQLELEHEHQNSDAVVAENIEANEYDFDEDGGRL